MVTERASVSTQAQQDFEELLTKSWDTAESALAKRGDLAPFGLLINESGHAQLVTADEREQHAAFDSLIAQVNDQRAELRATAIVAGTQLAQGCHAVRVCLEHCEGAAVSFVVPYQRRRFRRGISTGEMRRTVTQTHVW